jgi:hypothetical protein
MKCFGLNKLFRNFVFFRENKPFFFQVILKSHELFPQKSMKKEKVHKIAEMAMVMRISKYSSTLKCVREQGLI